MQSYRSFLVAVLLFVAGSVHAQSELTPVMPTAAAVLNRAATKAKLENKKVMLIFHASWCVWCRRMDSALNDQSCKKFFDDHFVVEHITVMEGFGRENLENAGGEQMMKEYNKDARGLPNWLILDHDKKLLYTSSFDKTQKDGSVKREEIGCPASQEEVDQFIAILKKTTSLTATELAIIAKRFRQNEQVRDH